MDLAEKPRGTTSAPLGVSYLKKIIINDEEAEGQKETDAGAFPFVSKSVPGSALVRLAAVEVGVLGMRSFRSADCASSLFLTVGANPKSASVRYRHTVSHRSPVRAGRRFTKYECVSLGVGEDSQKLKCHSTSYRKDDCYFFFPLLCDIQRHLLYKKSSSRAWCRDTRSPWVEIRQKGMLCCTGRHKQISNNNTDQSQRRRARYKAIMIQ